MNNKNLHIAQAKKADEFYTSFADVERELKNYPNAFKNKIIYLPCDDVNTSAFFKYFARNFEALGLSGLACTFKPASDDPGKTPTGFIFNTPEAARDAVKLLAEV